MRSQSLSVSDRSVRYKKSSPETRALPGAGRGPGTRGLGRGARDTGRGPGMRDAGRGPGTRGPGRGTRDAGGMEKPARGHGLWRESGLGAVPKEDGGGGTGPGKAG